MLGDDERLHCPRIDCDRVVSYVLEGHPWLPGGEAYHGNENGWYADTFRYWSRNLHLKVAEKPRHHSTVSGSAASRAADMKARVEEKRRRVSGKSGALKAVHGARYMNLGVRGPGGQPAAVVYERPKPGPKPMPCASCGKPVVATFRRWVHVTSGGLALGKKAIYVCSPCTMLKVFTRATLVEVEGSCVPGERR
jgi:hypothetical protein